MVQAFTQRDVYAWIQNGMHTLELMHEYMRILIHPPAAESRLVPVSTSSRLTFLIVPITEKKKNLGRNFRQIVGSIPSGS